MLQWVLQKAGKGHREVGSGQIQRNCTFLEYSQVQNSVMRSIPQYFSSLVVRKKPVTYSLMSPTYTKDITVFSNLSKDMWTSSAAYRVYEIFSFWCFLQCNCLPLCQYFTFPPFVLLHTLFPALFPSVSIIIFFLLIYSQL